MKIIFSTTLLLTILCSSIFSKVVAQTKIKTPEFKNTIGLLSVDKKAISQLEKKDGRIISKAKALGFGGETYSLTISGNSSGIQLENSDHTFIVKLPDNDTDPKMYVNLFKFEVNKSNRTVKIGKGNVMGMGGSKSTDITKANLIFTKVEDGIYLITTTETLPKGHYGFVLDFSSKGGFESKQNLMVFAFDVN